jgi:hypothetical protein
MAVSLREMKLFPISERLPYKLPSMPVALTSAVFSLLYTNLFAEPDVVF